MQGRGARGAAHGIVCALLAMAVILTSATVVSAQASPPGGLFGSGVRETGARQMFLFNLMLSEAHDSELPTGGGFQIPQQSLQNGGYSTMLVASTNYVRNRRRLQFTGTALSALRYYQELDRISATAHSGSVSLNVAPSRLVALRMDQTAAYSPSYLYQLFPATGVPVPGEPIPAAPDYQVNETRSYSYRSGATLTIGEQNRRRLTITGNLSRTDFQENTSGRRDLEVLSGSAGYSWNVGRANRISTSYDYRTGEFGFGGKTEEQRLTVGFEYNKPFSARRRLSLRANLTPSILDIPPSAEATAVTGRVSRLQGDASLNLQFTRAWSANASARRSVEYVAVLAEPVFADGGSLSVTGLFGRRTDLTASAGATVGGSVRTVERGDLNTYTGNLRLRVAASGSLAVFGEYLFYYYDLGQITRRVDDLPREFKQHGIRVGINWLFTTVGR